MVIVLVYGDWYEYVVQFGKCLVTDPSYTHKLFV